MHAETAKLSRFYEWFRYHADESSLAECGIAGGRRFRFRRRPGCRNK